MQSITKPIKAEDEKILEEILNQQQSLVLKLYKQDKSFHQKLLSNLKYSEITLDLKKLKRIINLITKQDPQSQINRQNVNILCQIAKKLSLLQAQQMELIVEAYLSTVTKGKGKYKMNLLLSEKEQFFILQDQNCYIVQQNKSSIQNLINELILKSSSKNHLSIIILIYHAIVQLGHPIEKYDSFYQSSVKFISQNRFTNQDSQGIQKICLIILRRIVNVKQSKEFSQRFILYTLALISKINISVKKFDQNIQPLNKTISVISLAKIQNFAEKQIQQKIFKVLLQICVRRQYSKLLQKIQSIVMRIVKQRLTLGMVKSLLNSLKVIDHNQNFKPIINFLVLCEDIYSKTLSVMSLQTRNSFLTRTISQFQTELILQIDIEQIKGEFCILTFLSSRKTDYCLCIRYSDTQQNILIKQYFLKKINNKKTVEENLLVSNLGQSARIKITIQKQQVSILVNGSQKIKIKIDSDIKSISVGANSQHNIHTNIKIIKKMQKVIYSKTVINQNQLFTKNQKNQNKTVCLLNTQLKVKGLFDFFQETQINSSLRNIIIPSIYRYLSDLGSFDIIFLICSHIIGSKLSQQQICLILGFLIKLNYRMENSKNSEKQVQIVGIQYKAKSIISLFWQAAQKNSLDLIFLLLNFFNANRKNNLDSAAISYLNILCNYQITQILSFQNQLQLNKTIKNILQQLNTDLNSIAYCQRIIVDSMVSYHQISIKIQQNTQSDKGQKTLKQSFSKNLQLLAENSSIVTNHLIQLIENIKNNQSFQAIAGFVGFILQALIYLQKNIDQKQWKIQKAKIYELTKMLKQISNKLSAKTYEKCIKLQERKEEILNNLKLLIETECKNQLFQIFDSKSNKVEQVSIKTAYQYLSECYLNFTIIYQTQNEVKINFIDNQFLELKWKIYFLKGFRIQQFQSLSIQSEKIRPAVLQAIIIKYLEDRSISDKPERFFKHISQTPFQRVLKIIITHIQIINLEKSENHQKKITLDKILSYILYDERFVITNSFQLMQKISFIFKEFFSEVQNIKVTLCLRQLLKIQIFSVQSEKLQKNYNAQILIILKQAFSSLLKSINYNQIKSIEITLKKQDLVQNLFQKMKQFTPHLVKEQQFPFLISDQQGSVLKMFLKIVKDRFRTKIIKNIKQKNKMMIKSVQDIEGKNETFDKIRKTLYFNYFIKTRKQFFLGVSSQWKKIQEGNKFFWKLFSDDKNQYYKLDSYCNPLKHKIFLAKDYKTQKIKLPQIQNKNTQSKHDIFENSTIRSTVSSFKQEIKQQKQHNQISSKRTFQVLLIQSDKIAQGTLSKVKPNSIFFEQNSYIDDKKYQKFLIQDSMRRTYEEINNDPIKVEIQLNDIKSIVPKKYLQKWQSLQILTDKCFFFCFEQRTAVAKFRNQINSPYIAKMLKANTVERYKVKWLDGRISNFTYLMKLNDYSGRTFNDLSQYYVFPWVLTNYHQDIEFYNLIKDEKNFRNLQMPMGRINDQRFKFFVQRYQQTIKLKQFNQKPFLYGTFYSNPAIVCSYLLRVHQFSTHHFFLQNKQFDLADRLFYSIEDQYKSSYENSSDVRQLIPQFYCSWQFLRNRNKYKFGQRQTQNQIVDDVILPKWVKTKTPEEFIFRMRKALQSRYTKQNIDKWIDLIFGMYALQQKALNACNLFDQHLYPPRCQGQKQQLENQQLQLSKLYYKQFGQVPFCIFQQKHPQIKIIGIQNEQFKNIELIKGVNKQKKIINRCEVKTLQFVTLFQIQSTVYLFSSQNNSQSSSKTFQSQITSLDLMQTTGLNFKIYISMIYIVKGKVMVNHIKKNIFPSEFQFLDQQQFPLLDSGQCKIVRVINNILIVAEASNLKFYTHSQLKQQKKNKEVNVNNVIFNNFSQFKQHNSQITHLEVSSQINMIGSLDDEGLLFLLNIGKKVQVRGFFELKELFVEEKITKLMIHDMGLVILITNSGRIQVYNYFGELLINSIVKLPNLGKITQCVIWNQQGSEIILANNTNIICKVDIFDLGTSDFTQITLTKQKKYAKFIEIGSQTTQKPKQIIKMNMERYGVHWKLNVITSAGQLYKYQSPDFNLIKTKQIYQNRIDND